eukprot:snap_masked-scaffold241_size241811-processed-gene-1.4 protein:Tk11758 transcript:snap_masked-scaffold241_size241811-processed-gene-1.4-mRNA-1 annotation:"carnitine o-palmitoyltransferase liver isoform-like isoform 1"
MLTYSDELVEQTIWSSVNSQGFLWLLSCLILAILGSLLAVSVVRFFLRHLFSYTGWIYLERQQLRNPPILIKIWMYLINLLISIRLVGKESSPGHPMLLSYQGALPSLPVPSLPDTIVRYLESIQPILPPEEVREMKSLADDFLHGLGPRLQKYLWLKRIWAENYVSDWWEEYVYLRGRSSLMINSNYYAIDAIMEKPTHIQAARAANCIHSAFSFRRILQKQAAAPLMVQGFVPLCSNQYERTFNTTRIPGETTDTIVHYDDSTHVVVRHQGRFYRVGCYHEGQLLTPSEIQNQIQGILDDSTLPDEGEEHLGVMTAANRTDWAQFRDEFCSQGDNRNSIQTIDSAAFVVILDDYGYDYNPDDTDELNQFGKMMLHGKGLDRWFDKSFCIIIGANARIGLNVEHSWADAPIVGHFWEFILVNDRENLGYDRNGNCSGLVAVPPPRAVRLRWTFPQSAQSIMADNLKIAEAMIDDLDLHILPFFKFGKGTAKTCNVSPDAFIQMSLQLAYFRNAGQFCQTYEASMTRLFRDGRTETVRPCTNEAVAWVRAMDDPNAETKTKVALLRLASQRHQRQCQDCMTGKGVDRHLFCLYVVSKYLEEGSPFLEVSELDGQKVLSEPWRLSTSQTAVRGEFLDIRKSPELLSCGGGFGPVADDGYGVSYIIIGEDRIFFHVSSKKNCSKTERKLMIYCTTLRLDSVT